VVLEKKKPWFSRTQAKNSRGRAHSVTKGFEESYRKKNRDIANAKATPRQKAAGLVGWGGAVTRPRGGGGKTCTTNLKQAKNEI